MAPHKNQHYVPRCYLKPFTLNGDGRVINVYNAVRQKGIAAAPVKGQCARSYFYGKDLQLEKLVQKSEELYSTTIRRVALRTPISDDHRRLLRHFSLLQYCRTEAASRRMAMAYSEMSEIAFSGNPPDEMKVPFGEFVQDGMRAFADSFHAIDDLKVCLIWNNTNRQIITSDDPSKLTNRW